MDTAGMHDPMIVEDTVLRDKTKVFRDRTHAGEVLASMLDGYRGGKAVVMGIPAGGLPVAATVANRLGLPFEAAVVSRVVAPWTTEVGCGAVAFDGTVSLNHELICGLGLTKEEIQDAVEKSCARVTRRCQRLRGEKPFPELAHGASILIDDGLASEFVMQAAIRAVRNAGADSIIIAVPTAHEPVLQEIARSADKVYCANVRSGFRFTTSDAYSLWTEIRDADLGRVSMAVRAELGRSGGDI